MTSILISGGGYWCRCFLIKKELTSIISLNFVDITFSCEKERTMTLDHKLVQSSSLHPRETVIVK